jgi:hypothetical protein
LNSRYIVELVRYKPGEAIRWLETGADNIRKGAQNRGLNLLRQTGGDSKTFGENLKTAAGALFDFGKGTYAEMMHRQAEDSEFVLQEEQFDIVNGGNMKTIPYNRVVAVHLKGDRATLTLDKGIVVLKPFAYIVAGRIKVPVGWVRNGIEVPYELLLLELSARCGVDIQEEG